MATTQRSERLATSRKMSLEERNQIDIAMYLAREIDRQLAAKHLAPMNDLPESSQGYEKSSRKQDVELLAGFKKMTAEVEAHSKAMVAALEAEAKEK